MPGIQYRLMVAAESSGGLSEYSEACFVTWDPLDVISGVKEGAPDKLKEDWAVIQTQQVGTFPTGTWEQQQPINNGVITTVYR